MHQGHVPERVLTVHHRAQNLSCQRLQLRVGAVLERSLAYVVANVEGWVIFPAGQANIKERGHHTLEIAGNQRQFRFDKLDTSFEWDLALKHADTGHVEGHALAFEVEENRISPGKAVTLLLALHRGSPISVFDLRLRN